MSVERGVTNQLTEQAIDQCDRTSVHSFSKFRGSKVPIQGCQSQVCTERLQVVRAFLGFLDFSGAERGDLERFCSFKVKNPGKTFLAAGSLIW